MNLPGFASIRGFRSARVVCAVLLLAHLGCQASLPLIPERCDCLAECPRPSRQATTSHADGSAAAGGGDIVSTSAFEEPGTLTLNDAIALALQNNPRLRETSAHVAEARAGETVSFAAYFPEFNTSYLFAGFNVPVIPGGAFVPASLNGGVEHYSLAEVGAEWTLYDFGLRSAEFNQAVSKTRMRELSFVRAGQSVAFAVTRGYFQLLLARAVLRVHEQAFEQARLILTDTKARQKGGVVDREAVLRAEVEVSQAEEKVLASRQAVRDAESTLNLTMGRPVTLPIQTVDILARPEFAANLDGCIEQGLTVRPEVQAARQLIEASSFGVDAARSAMKPRVFMRGTVVRADSPSSTVRGWVTGAGLHVTQPLFAGGKYRGEVRKQQAKTAAANAALQSILDQVAQQVNLAYQAINTNRQRIRLGEKTVAQAKENLRQTLVKYRNGNATPTDVVDAQTALVEAQTRYYASVYRYLDGLAQLEYAMGGDQARLLAELAEDSEELPVPRAVEE